jgi:predicted outer membrane repeat protein
MRNGSGRARFLLTLAYNNGDGGPVAFATGSFELNACLVAAPDLDGDGFGAGPGTISPSSCELPAGFAWRIDDCAPNDPARHPNSVWYRDNDGDGIGAAADGTLQNCVGAAGYTLIGGDNCPQLPNPDQQDCDSDDLGDACEFAFGNETDLDGNSVPDSCELLVGGSGFSSIQAAIAAAPDGSTILVAPGTHAPFEVTGRRLTIRGLDAARRPIVHGLGAARCATISLAQNGPVRLEHLEFADGAAGNGGGINALLSELELIHCVFRGCAADAEGGGVALYASAARIENCRFESNHAQDGGALFATGSFSPDHPTEIVATRFVLNSAGSVGGAIASRTAILVDDCEFASNDAATLGGGIWSSSKSATSVRASGFCDNAPLDWFGPIVDLGSSVFGPDCDANRACDLGEIAADPSLDTNQNAELDDCERSRGDLNLDGTVNGADLALLLNRWGNIGDSEADLNGDGIVNASDLSLLLNGWSS